MYIYIYIYIYIYTHTAYSIASTLNQNLLGLVFVCDCDPHVSLSCVCVLELLSMDDVETLLDATGCSAEIKRPVCKGDCLSERYRTITGHCNNRQNPLLGAANTPYARWLPPAYEDFHGTPRGWNPQHTYNNFTLPPVRIVSQEVLYTQNEKISLDLSLSHLLVEWGQWIDHDLSLTPQSPSTASFRTGADCIRTCSRDTPCFPIQIPFSDPRRGVQRCMPFFRSAPSCVDASVVCRHREQLNAITAFVDANMVYGSSDALAQSLRNLSSPLGLLTHNHLHSDQGLAYLPYLPRKQLDPCAPRQGSNTGKNTTSMGNLTFCYLAGGIDPVLRGLLLSPAKLQAPEQMMVEELTERLFQAHGGLPLDLGALNLQRGRDHGLPGYGAWREFCGLSVPANESDLIEILENGGLVRKLLALYGTVWNIDVWVGAISEPALPGGRVGPLLACLIAKQFRALRDGDRFWWEREGVFSTSQRSSLRTVSLSRIICDNTHICLVPSDPFVRTDHPDQLLPCAHTNITHFNLSAWKEPDTGRRKKKNPVCGSIPRLKVGFSVMCNSAVLYQCPSGYLLRGATHITCDPNTRLWTPNPPTCQDIDECFSGPVCPPNLLCHNTPGSFICTESTTHSATSIAAAVMTMVGGVAVMVLIVTCYTRFIRKGSISRACCNKKH
ncbi:thyroid peroxidase isoform X6 [Neoarius graeffei]|uniref:thyroid peroxidase isoform X6 n=1 Tax=Neoarius graeffei TaxID=443677 RepID=UPI00298CD03D|nr:thyroid peroxidase isoform X6 [Neoarius graeffei]